MLKLLIRFARCITTHGETPSDAPVVGPKFDSVGSIPSKFVLTRFFELELSYAPELRLSCDARRLTAVGDSADRD